jgi:hypothetical protein
MRFVGTAGEIASALEAPETDSARSASDDFFWLDPGLPRWRRLFGFAV